MNLFRISSRLNKNGISFLIEEFSFTESPLNYIIDTGTKRIKKSSIDKVDTIIREDMIKIAPYVVWSFDVDYAKNLLSSKIHFEVEKRLEYYEELKSIFL